MNTILVVLVLILSFCLGFVIGMLPRKPKKPSKNIHKKEKSAIKQEELRMQKRRQKEFENMMTYDGSKQEEIVVD